MTSIFERITSRKFILTIAGAVISASSIHFGVDPELALKIIASLFGGYIGTEGLADITRAAKSNPNPDQTP